MKKNTEKVRRYKEGIVGELHTGQFGGRVERERKQKKKNLHIFWEEEIREQITGFILIRIRDDLSKLLETMSLSSSYIGKPHLC